MTTYINTGAYINGERPQTKRALKDAVHAGQEVSFDGTSPFAPGWWFASTMVEHDDGTKFSVVGPDPFTSRKWYATVEVKNGQVRVS